jgi:hypothetical protein
MSREEINKRNMSIADFMGCHKYTSSHYNVNHMSMALVLFSDLKYHSSWDWLMPVVEKIELSDSGRYLMDINRREVILWDYQDYPEINVLQIDCYDDEPKIDMVFMACSEFCLKLLTTTP